MKWCLVYLASPKENRVNCEEFSHIKKIELLRGSMLISKRMFPEVDIIVFHEDFTEKEKESLPSVKHYIQVDFSGKKELYDLCGDFGLEPKEIENVLKGNNDE